MFVITTLVLGLKVEHENPTMRISLLKLVIQQALYICLKWLDQVTYYLTINTAIGCDKIDASQLLAALLSKHYLLEQEGTESCKYSSS